MRQARPTVQPTPSSRTPLPADIGSASVAVLVEGFSDQAAVHALARRQGRDLVADGVAVVPIGGATNIGRHMRDLHRKRPHVRILGLCDADEEHYYRRAAEQTYWLAVTSRTQMQALGFFVCDVDLEDELIRGLGPEAVLEVFDRAGALEKFRLYQRQPAHRNESLGRQLRGYVTNGKIRWARQFIDSFDLRQVPPPLAGLLGAL